MSKTRKQKNEKKDESAVMLLLEQRPRSTRLRRAAVSTFLMILGIYITYVISLFESDGQPFDKFCTFEASLGGFYANMLVVVATSYDKASSRFWIKGSTYILCLVAFILVAHIFVQAISMHYPTVSLYRAALCTPAIALIGQLLFIGTIFALFYSEGIQSVPKYKKEKL